MNLNLSSGDILTLFAISVALAGILVDLAIGVAGLVIATRSFKFARLAALRERRERREAAVVRVSSNGSYGTVAITNVSRSDFTVKGIIFVTDTEIIAHRGDIRTTDCKQLPQFFKSGAEVRFGIAERTLQKIPVNGTPGVILELPARKTLVCKVC